MIIIDDHLIMNMETTIHHTMHLDEAQRLIAQMQQTMQQNNRGGVLIVAIIHPQTSSHTSYPQQQPQTHMAEEDIQRSFSQDEFFKQLEQNMCN
jgi:hypothetical protein